MVANLFETSYVKRIRSHFRIKDVENLNYIRVGRDNDGGYTMVDDFAGVKNVYSCGINDDVSWDLDFLNRRNENVDIFMYDHTIDQLPQEHESFHFFKTGISGVYDSTHPELDTIPRLISKNGHQDDYNMILKMDIEGSEYDMLETIDVDTLNHFTQIIMEIHWLLNINNENKISFCLDKLNATHQLVYIHGNNCVDHINRGGLVLPDVVECTYLRRDKYNFIESKRFFPTALDQPCTVNRPEINLGFWK